MTPEEEILAANASYVPNRATPFTVTPEGQKYGVIDINGTVGHIQQDKRTPEQQNALFQLYQSIAPAQIDANDPIAVRNYNTQVYNQLHKEGKVDDFYRSKGLIARNAPTQAAPAPKTATDIVNEATTKGKSFLQLYQENMPKPEYEQERADRIQTNSKASIIADILKLVGEGITTKKGGQPIVRQSAVPMLNAELQKLNDTYKAEAKAYKQGGFNALLMDEQEKKRSAALDAAREAAIQQIKIKADIEQRQREKQEQSELTKIKTKHELDMQRDKINNEAKVKTANISASGRKNSGSTTTNERGDILIDGNIVKPKQAYVNDVAAKVKSEAKVTDPVMGMSATEIFVSNWNKYFDYVNGEFVPKGAATTITTGSRASRATQSNAPRSRASN